MENTCQYLIENVKIFRETRGMSIEYVSKCLKMSANEYIGH